MHDDFQADIESFESLEGAIPRRLFPRVLIVGEHGSDERRDAAALAAALTPGAEAVTVPERADLIVTGSAGDGVPGRAALDQFHRPPLEGAHCPVAVATRGLAERDDYELRRCDVGIDGGRGASAALAVGIRLALAHDARLRLIAVAELDSELGGTAGKPEPRELERLSRHLANASDRLAGVWVETELREGPADQILLGQAREADLLLLGSRAVYGSPGRVTLGEVATAILRDAPCPVMVVPTV